MSNMPDNIEYLPEKILDASVDKNLSDIAVNIAEMGLDELLDDGVLKDIPVIGLLLKSYSTFIGIRDRLFFSKVVRFLYKLKNVPDKVREDFMNNMNKDIKHKKKVSDTIIIVLDRLDSLEKSDMIAKVFQCYMNGKINFSDFKRLSSAIEQAYIDDLLRLIGHITEQGNFQGDYIENLLGAGLVALGMVRVVTATGSSAGSVTFELSDLGYLFKMVMNDEWYDHKSPPVRISWVKPIKY